MKSKLEWLAFSATALGLAVLAVSAGCSQTTEPVPQLTVGTEIDDSIVTGRVKAALLADPEVKSFDIAAVTRKGEVQLSGFVDTQAQVDRALAVTKSVAGVKSVSNEMSIKK